MKQTSPITIRKSSGDHSRQSSSLEPDLSTFRLRRRKTDKSSGIDDSPLVSPSFHRAGPTGLSGDSSKSNLDVQGQSSSVASSISGASKYPLNVSDWNEKVLRETKQSDATDSYPRHPVDPPRPPKEGFEWVWFPEGYWAERERIEPTKKNRKTQQKWFKRPDRRSSGSLLESAKANSKANFNELPAIKIGSQSTSPSKSTTKSQNGEDGTSVADNRGSRDSPGNKILRGLQVLSATYPHFVSQTSDPEGLYCKTKRGLGVVSSKQKMYTTDAALRSECSLPSQTTLLLQGANSYFDQTQNERGPQRQQYLEVHPQTPLSPDSRSRRGFGLAPWHRKNSQESFLSSSSSVHRMLRGRTPAATPVSDLRGGPSYANMDISDPRAPNFLPSEATRILTPKDETPDFFADWSPDEEPKSDLDTNSPHTNTSESSFSGFFKGFAKEPKISTEGIRPLNAFADTDRQTARKNKKAKQIRRFELDSPEHLPSSPLCPKNPKHKSGGTGICVYHGRRRSVGLKKTDNGNSDSHDSDWAHVKSNREV